MKKIVIVGGGVVGCAVAREMTRFDCEVVVAEKCFDVSEGTSKANSGIVHAGFDAEVGSKKAKFNVAGNAMFDKLSKELDFPFYRNGAFVLCFDDSGKKSIQDLAEKGAKNGVKNLFVLTGDEARAKEPALSDKVKWALYAADSGIVSPYEMTLALGENAVANGAKFEFGFKVVALQKRDDGYLVKSADGRELYADVVVNCAGLYADELNDLAGSDKKFKITPRRGQYMLMDKQAGKTVTATVFQLPTEKGKGVLVAPTVHGNLLIGPTAEDIDDKSDVDTTFDGLQKAFETAKISVPSLSKRDVITQFAGNRAHDDKDDFIVDWTTDAMFTLGGIESPGLTSAPALGEFAAIRIAEKLTLSKKSHFKNRRIDTPHIANLSNEQYAELVKKDGSYAKIVCRCERVSEGEIRDSIRRPLGARDLDGVKRRTRAGMGRCQSGFCCPRILEIISEELGIPMEKITKNSINGCVLTGRID